MTIGERMKAVRLERGVTQVQLAAILHIKQGSLSMIESDEFEVGEDLAGRIRAWIDSGQA